jgi:hypothetical protein
MSEGLISRNIKTLLLFTEVKRRLLPARARPSRKSEKPNIHFQHYKNYRMLIRLRRWCMTHQANSLIQASYSSHPRNPE